MMQADDAGLRFLPLEHGWDCHPDVIEVVDPDGGRRLYASELPDVDGPQRRPSDPSLTGEDLRIEPVKDGAALRVTDRKGNSCLYYPMPDAP